MSPEITAAIIAGSVGIVTVIATVIVQIVGFRATRANTEQQIRATHQDTADTLSQQSEHLDKTLAEQRTRTLNERFSTAAEQLGDDKPAVRLAGVYAMAGLADDWQENRQTCVDVLCAYLRMPYAPDPGQDAPESERLAFQAIREVRHTVIRVITAHLRSDAAVSWQSLNFDFTGVVFDGGDFSGAKFSGGMVNFSHALFSGGWTNFRGAEFSGAPVHFGLAEFSGGTVDFSHALFSGGTVRFTTTEFSGGTVSFYGTKFSRGAVNFSYARFSGGRVYFNRAQFSGAAIVGFDRAQFSGGDVDFSDAGDWSFPPAFPWTGMPPAGVKLPRKVDPSEA
jgi:hypothetical protein